MSTKPIFSNLQLTTPSIGFRFIVQRAPSVLARLAFALAVSFSARAQSQTDANFDAAPPPLKRLASEDRTKLDSARDARERTRFSLELADAHLARAAELTERKDYDAAATELGFYQGVISDALKFLKRANEPNRNRLRDLFKRVELTLRAHAPRIEGIRRETPSEYEANVRAVYDFTRDARDEALNVFYGNTVLREEPATPKKPR